MNSAWPLNFWILAWLAPHDGYIYLENSLLWQLFFSAGNRGSWILIRFLSWFYAWLWVQEMPSHASVSSPEKQKLHLPLGLTRLCDSVVEAYTYVLLFTISSDLLIVHGPHQYSTEFNWPPPPLPQIPDLIKKSGCFSPSVVLWFGSAEKHSPWLPLWYSDCQQSSFPHLKQEIEAVLQTPIH